MGDPSGLDDAELLRRLDAVVTSTRDAVDAVSKGHPAHLDDDTVERGTQLAAEFQRRLEDGSWSLGPEETRPAAENIETFVRDTLDRRWPN